ncbi:transglutaminase domain-containing protein [Pseudoflavonifractor sp. An85]|uniref:transglutaminase domain-containing protein n=1 Tax=Pseudoflavonifractor sp. An85 TaxID=1965661 RepID=UPI000B397E75|nr:transglutaminase domain-containing protein [Pseudoflavonifractor sp. An85]OUN24261.1 hypothetical protein B5G37_08175 [Pseudoflavonifractor sp. An85]
MEIHTRKPEHSRPKRRDVLFMGGFFLLLLLALLTGCSSEEAPAPTPTFDQEPPIIFGAKDLEVVVNGTISYRHGITVTDDSGETPQLTIDGSQVDLSTPGSYPLTYSAVDNSGNVAKVTITVTVVVEEAQSDPSPSVSPSAPPPSQTKKPGAHANGSNAPSASEKLNALADQILTQIINGGMSKQQKARAIYNYIRSHMRYVNSSDKSSWISAAYIGLTQGKGDCFNYFAASKILLTRAGIANVDLYRVGGQRRGILCGAPA